MNFLFKLTKNDLKLFDAIDSLMLKASALDLELNDDLDWKKVKDIINNFIEINKEEVEYDLIRLSTDRDKMINMFLLHKQIEPKLIQKLEIELSEFHLSTNAPRLKNILVLDISQDVKNPNKIIIKFKLTYSLFIYDNSKFSEILNMLNFFYFNQGKNVWLTYYYKVVKQPIKEFDLTRLYYTNKKMEKLITEILTIKDFINKINLDLPLYMFGQYKDHLIKGSYFEDTFDLSNQLENEIYTYLLSLYNNYEGSLILENFQDLLFNNKFIKTFLELRICTSNYNDKKFFSIEFKKEYLDKLLDENNNITFNDILKEVK